MIQLLKIRLLLIPWKIACLAMRWITNIMITALYQILGVFLSDPKKMAPSSVLCLGRQALQATCHNFFLKMMDFNRKNSHAVITRKMTQLLKIRLRLIPWKIACLAMRWITNIMITALYQILGVFFSDPKKWLPVMFFSLEDKLFSLHVIIFP